jgi:hypothetical protein
LNGIVDEKIMGGWMDGRLLSANETVPLTVFVKNRMLGMDDQIW